MRQGVKAIAGLNPATPLVFAYQIGRSLVRIQPPNPSIQRRIRESEHDIEVFGFFLKACANDDPGSGGQQAVREVFANPNGDFKEFGDHGPSNIGTTV